VAGSPAGGAAVPRITYTYILVVRKGVDTSKKISRRKPWKFRNGIQFTFEIS
jgi:hypothetical protein